MVEDEHQWLMETLERLEPPQGYITDNGAEDETTAVLMMCLEGLFDADNPAAKEEFLQICSRVWDMNILLSQP